MGAWLAAAVLAAAASGCVASGSFQCSTDTQCGAQGQCSAPGYCSFPDPGCNQTGRRFGEHAGQGLGGQCVVADGGLGDGGPMADGPTSDAPLSDGGPMADGPTSDGPMSDGGPSPDATMADASMADAGVPTCISELAVGGYHVCVRKGGAVECWGSDDNGQLGDGRTIRSSTPRPVSGLTNAVELSLGNIHSCARTQTGAVLCWGANTGRQLGSTDPSDRTTPLAISGLTAKAIAAGAYFNCAIDSSDAVQCWGYNDSEQLGTSGPIESATLIHPTNAPAASAIDAGRSFACALSLSPAGQVWCWGRNAEGQLGDGSTTPRSGAVQASISNVAELATGFQHTCVRKNDGTVWCWGDNGAGQLGRGSPSSSGTPLQVTQVSGATALWSGWDSTCARLDTGVTTCWGNDSYGKLGDGSPTYNQTSPMPTRYSGVVEMGFGDTQGCALIGSGVRCTGIDYFGSLGVGVLTASATPVAAVLTDVAQVSAGHFHTCAVLGTGAPRCWGYNLSGQIGDGSGIEIRPAPVAVSGLASVTEIIGGDRATCARRAGGASCWGENGTHQLGNNETPPMSHDSPVALATLTTVDELDLNIAHGCARVGGAVHCWGENMQGEVGDGTTTPRPAPVPTSITSGAISVSTGRQFTCVATTTGVTCWGINDTGNLGDGSNAPRSTPVQVQLFGGGALTGVLELASGWEHTCARTAAAVYCWGNGYSGQIGDGGGTPRFSARVVPGLMALQIAAHAHNSCALKMDRTVVCWGDNFFGQIGDGSNLQRSTPTPVSGLGNVAQITVGAVHACARRMDSTLACWGNNENGELGTSPTLLRLDPLPAQVSCP